MVDKKTVFLWERLHKNPHFCPVYPHDRTIKFVFDNFSKSEASRFKILDFGCGAGRHLIFLAENGYRAYGADVSRQGILVAKQRLWDRKLKAELKILLGDKPAYLDNYFDGIVCFGVLYYLSGKILDVVVPELKRVLKSGGKAFFVIRSKKDYRINHSIAIGNGDYKIIGDKESRVGNEAGMPMHFFDRKEIKKRFGGWSEIRIDEVLNTYYNGKFIDCDYIVEVTK